MHFALSRAVACAINKLQLQRQNNIQTTGAQQGEDFTVVTDKVLNENDIAQKQRHHSRLTQLQHHKRFFKKLRIITSIAAFLVLVFISWKVYSFYNLSPQKIYNQLFISYPKSVINNKAIIGAGSIKESFVRKDYNEVVLLQKASQSFTNLDSLLIGISYLQIDEAPKAIKWLQPIAQIKTGMYQDAQFYLSLAYLVNKDFDPSIDLMQKIVRDTTHLYHKEIQQKNVNDVKMVKWR